MEKIPVFKPLLENEELGAAEEALRLGWLGMGSYVSQFEQDLRQAISPDGGTTDRHVAVVSTGHAALHIACMLIGLGPGDEVITPSFNNIADFQAVLATGAKLVFCDIDPRTLCIDVASAASAVSKSTKAIIGMDYFCSLHDHDAVKKLADAHGLRVIHDAAHSIGSRYKGKPVGSFADMTMFSFDPVKTVTAIDGGALIVRSAEELARVHEMRLVGMGQPAAVMYTNQRAWTYDVKTLGFRYHMANLHAALGVQQLKKLPRITASRRSYCRHYEENFRGIKGLTIPTIDYENITPFLYWVRVDADRRDAFRAHLLEQGVDTGLHWQPGHWFSLFKDVRRTDLSVTEQVGRELVSIPLHSNMSIETLERVVGAVRSFFR